MGTCENQVSEAVLTCTHNVCFEVLSENIRKIFFFFFFFFNEIFIFFLLKKSVNIAWTHFRNDTDVDTW